MEVVIVGAGLGGLATALALHQRGINVTVFEQVRHLEEVGAGITLSPNATKAIHSLGLGDGLAAVATQVRAQGVLHHQDGRILVENDRGDEPLKRYGAHYYQLHRADLHKLLLCALVERAPSAIQLGREVIAYESNTTGVTVEFAQGDPKTTDLLIGCDGIRSTIRDQLLGPREPQFTHRVAWRGLVPSERINHLNLPLASAMMIAPGKNLGLYPIRNGQLINYVAICTRMDWAEEGWNLRSTPEELLAEFHDWYPPVLELLAATPSNQCFKWGLFDHAPFETWSGDRVTLAGDAAHAMLPYMGQGAAMAIEDGIVLARCLEQFSDTAEALSTYERVRKPRTSLCQQESKLKGERWKGDNPDSYDKPAHRNEESIGLFEYDAATVRLV